MHRFFFLAIIVFGVLVQAVASARSMPERSPVIGVWANPKRSVHVRTEPCDDRLCGTIVYASRSAIARAKEKGLATLEGIRVFDGLRRRDDGVWRGKVYVPDRGGRFASTLTPLDDDRLEVRGCILGGLICKSQIWTRVK